MKYGNFSQRGDEFIITRPDTPRPWDNHFGNDRYGVVFTTTGGGFSMNGDTLRHMVTYYQPRFDQAGRYVYLHDHDNGDYWTINHQPVKAGPARFQCRQGMGQSIIRSSHGRIDSELTVFVPRDEAVELWIVTLTNRSNRRRRLTVFPYVEWLLESARPGPDDIAYAAGSDCDYDPASRSVVGKRRENWRTRMIRKGFLTADFAPSGYDGKRNAFVGPGRSLADPLAVERGRCFNSAACAEITCGALSRRLTLAPGASRTFHVMVGLAQTAGERNRLRRKFFGKPGAVERALAKVQSFWEAVAANGWLETPDPKLDRTFNFWMKKHVYTLGVGNTVRTFTKGFRDHLQDAMGMVWIDPAVTRSIILEAMPAQYQSGNALRRWAAGLGGPMTNPAEDLKFWLVFATAAYIKQTGDFSILKEKRPFYDSPKRTSLLDRLHLVVDLGLKQRGPHGLSLIGHGEWNDGLNAVGVRGKGESVWLSEALVWALREVAELDGRLGDPARARRYARAADQVAGRINTIGWDGQWYRQAFNDDGRPIGTKANREGRIYLMPQSWAVIAGIASPAKRKALFRSIDRDLETAFGTAVMAPGYTEVDPAIGGITSSQAGMSENASIYCHATSFKIYADCLAGRGNDAYATWNRLMPFNHDPDRTRAEPYIVGNLYRGPDRPQVHGLTSRSWQTSTPNWLLKSVVEGMMGLRPGYEGLTLAPAIPARWRRCRIRVRVGRADFDVRIENPRHVQSGVASITYDGRPIRGDTVPLPRDASKHTVVVTLGKPD